MHQFELGCIKLHTPYRYKVHPKLYSDWSMSTVFYLLLLYKGVLVRALNLHLFFFFFFFVSLIADGPHHYHPACGHKRSSHLSPVHALQFFLSRCKFSTLTTRQLIMVEFYLLTFPRFPLRKKEHKSYFGKNRTHDYFRTSRCAAYLLDHSGDELPSGIKNR